MNARRGRRRIGLLLAVALGVPLVLGATAAPAAAASPPRLSIVGAAQYLVQPDRHRVHITVDLRITNRASETLTTRYVFDRANLAVLPGTTGFRATENGTKVGVSVVTRTAKSTLLAIGFGKRLGSGQSTSIRLLFELPDQGGAPSRPVRVGPSLVAFPVWAFGTRGVAGSTVGVRFPAGYQVTIGAGRLSKPVTAADGTTSVSSGSLADPFALSGYVMADRPGAFTETPLDVPLDGAVAHLTIRAWKDDPAWTRKTSAFLKRALPALSSSIGLPYRRTTTVAIEETVSRSIDGLAGIYDPASSTIRIAYTADPAVMLGQAAHLWYDGSVFADRWAVAGLASLAANGAAQQLKLKDAVGPTVAPSTQLFPLNAWVPGSGSDEGSAAADAYGYAASAELIRLVASRTGAEGLRAVVAAAAARPAGNPLDWRGLLDLLQTQAGVDATDLWRAWVVRPEDAVLLDARAMARFDQSALVREANGWILPAEIDGALDAWRFDEANTTIAASRSVLQARDDLAVAAAVAGLEPPTNLRTAFEAGDLDAAKAEAAVERAIVVQIVAAQAAGAATSSSWLVRFGLLGQDPNGELASAGAAFSAGDLSAAQARAIGAREAWAAASDLGGLRLRSILALLLVLALAALLITTRARRHPRRTRVGYESEIG